jgi:hypothetical protein
LIFVILALLKNAGLGICLMILSSGLFAYD